MARSSRRRTSRQVLANGHGAPPRQVDRLWRAVHHRAIQLALGRSARAEEERISKALKALSAYMTPIELMVELREAESSAEALHRALRKNARVPAKYLGGLRGSKRASRRRELVSRRREAERHGSSRRPRSVYREFKTDRGIKTRPSSYTERFHKKYGKVRGGIPEVARATRDDVAPDVHLNTYTSVLREVYNRGMAAWATGHRPGATQQQWAYARVYSFILGGKTRSTADADLWREIR